jgi:hypothetical protein
MISQCFAVGVEWKGKEEEARTVLHVHLYGRSIGRLAHPEVQILSFSSLEEKYIVAIVQFCQLVQLV